MFRMGVLLVLAGCMGCHGDAGNAAVQAASATSTSQPSTSTPSTTPSTTSPSGLAPTFTLQKQVRVNYGALWCIPVFDGSQLVVTTEAAGEIYAATFDTDLVQTSTQVMIAGHADTGGQSIADHKHVFMDGYHYVTFSIGGNGQGGDLYLLKLDRNLQRVGIVQVTVNNPPTNDMFMVADGARIHVGKFAVTTRRYSHQIFSYDTNLSFQSSVYIGDGTDRHANGAACIYRNNTFHLVAPQTLAPGQGDFFSYLPYDASWQLQASKTDIHSDPSMISLVTGLSHEVRTDTYVVHYARALTHNGGDLQRVVFDANWQPLSSEVAIVGDYQRPHTIVVNDTMIMGFDGGGVHLSKFALGVR